MTTLYLYDNNKVKEYESEVKKKKKQVSWKLQTLKVSIIRELQEAMTTGKKLFTAVVIWILVLFGTLALILVFYVFKSYIYVPFNLYISWNNMNKGVWLIFCQNRLSDPGVSSDGKLVTSHLPNQVNTVTRISKNDKLCK